MEFLEDLKQATRILKEGGTILYPTDTIWGLGCDATNPSAVEKIFRIKSRTDSKSLIILVNGETMLERYVSNLPETALRIIQVSDNPVTIIYTRGKNLAAGVCADDGSVGVRICNDEFCNKLITNFRKPVVSTSANISGKPAPANFGEIDPEIVHSVDYVVKHKQNDRQERKASPVIKIDNNGVLKILRM